VRVGHGFDAHRFIAGQRLVIGGVEIPHTHGMEAHSDGDVLIHALCDALLGAAALGDIGLHFPDTDPELKGVDSRVLLRHVVVLLDQRALRVGNADITVVAQAPRLRPHIDEMRQTLSSDLGISGDQINIKATTTEGMGFAGRKEGIAAHAVVLVLDN